MAALTGRSLAAYRVGWAGALLASLAAAAAGQVQAPDLAKLLHQSVLVAVAVILIRRRTADPVAAMLSLAFLIWAATASPLLPDWIGGAAAAMLDRLRFLLFVSAMLLFPDGRRQPAWTGYALTATAAVAAIGCLAALGFVSTRTYQLLAMGCAALAVAAMRSRFRALPPGMECQQIKWVALGLGAGLFLVGTSRLAAPMLAPASAGPLFDAGVILMALGVLGSLLRYRLYDADAAISRSTAYTALTLTLLIVFGVSEAALQGLSQAWFGGSAGIVTGGLAAGVAAALTAPAHGRLTAWADRRFQAALVDLRDALPARLDDLREFAPAALIAREIVDAVEGGVQPARLALIRPDASPEIRNAVPAVVTDWAGTWRADESLPINCDASDPLFPLRVPLRVAGRGLVGWLLLGPRPDGTLSSAEEREALTAIAAPAARALLVADEREKRASAMAQLADRVTTDLMSLSARLRSLEDSDTHRELLRKPLQLTSEG